jgi:hypothetical protein
MRILEAVLVSRIQEQTSLKNARTSEPQERKNKRVSTKQEETRGDPMKLKQPLFEFETQIQPLDLSSVENIAVSIALLRAENDRLRRMAALLIAQTESMRRSLLPAKSADWRPSSRLRALR